ncbi:hypothetical protein MCOR18_000523 [Pyricularia oryzae]|nr:hypothetical protein MCOR18_000523 [Pyricularia oryzae]
MRELQLRLDSIELALRELPGKLRLESEVTLGIPDEWLIDVTPAMISCTVAAGELWVERASPCRLHIDPVVSSGLATIADDSSHERRLVNAVRTCSREPVQTELSTDSTRVTRSGRKRSLPQSSENVPSQPEQLTAAEVDLSVRILVKGSLYTLLGIKKATPRIMRLRIFESPSLLEIAPAAFNMRYLQLDRDSNHIHNLPQQSEMEGLPSGEQVNNKLEADDAQLGLHLVVHDMNDPDSSDLRHHLYEPLQSPGSTQEPEGAPSLNEDQRLGNNSQEHMQKYNSHVPKYQQTWQAFEQDDFFGDNYDTDQYIDDEEGTVGYYNAGHYSWVPDTDNEIANPYLGSGNDYEPEAEGCPYFSSSFAPPPVLENEAGILEDCFEDEPQKTDITSSQDSGSENLEQLGGYDQVFVDELGDQYVYEESHMLGNDGQYTVDNGALSSDLTPWEWDGGQRDDVDVDSWNQTQISLWAVRT